MTAPGPRDISVYVCGPSHIDRRICEPSHIDMRIRASLRGLLDDQAGFRITIIDLDVINACDHIVSLDRHTDDIALITNDTPLDMRLLSLLQKNGLLPSLTAVHTGLNPETFRAHADDMCLQNIHYLPHSCPYGPNGSELSDFIKVCSETFNPSIKEKDAPPKEGILQPTLPGTATDIYVVIPTAIKSGLHL